MVYTNFHQSFFRQCVYVTKCTIERKFSNSSQEKSVMLPTYEAALVLSIGKHPD